MPIVSKDTLKSYFENGKVPNYDRYLDLIDTMGNMATENYDANEDGIVDNADMLDGQHASAFAPSGFGLGTTCQDISGSNMNTIRTTGFYRGYSTTNAPRYTTWFYYVVLRHSDIWVTQIAYYYYEREVYFRQCDSGSWTSWESIFPAQWADIEGRPATYPPSSHTHVGGDITSQVGDANTVDGLHAASFVRADANDTKTGDLRMSGGLTLGITTVDPANGRLVYTENMTPNRGGTNYTSHPINLRNAYVSFTSSQFIGGQSSGIGRTRIDMSNEVPSLPTAYIKGYYLKIAFRDLLSSTYDAWGCVGATTTLNQGDWFGANGAANNTWSRCKCKVKADANGDIWYNTYGSGTNSIRMVWQVLNYYL